MKSGNFILIISILVYLINAKTFTIDELRKFDGSDSQKPILLAIKGIVYDVTSGSSFYGKDGSYNPLAGRACARAVAKWSTHEEYLTDDISNLHPEELKQLDNIIDKIYKKKYKIVGYMDYYNGEKIDL